MGYSKKDIKALGERFWDMYDLAMSDRIKSHAEIALATAWHIRDIGWQQAIANFDTVVGEMALMADSTIIYNILAASQISGRFPEDGHIMKMVEHMEAGNWEFAAAELLITQDMETDDETANALHASRLHFNATNYEQVIREQKALDEFLGDSETLMDETAHSLIRLGHYEEAYNRVLDSDASLRYLAIAALQAGDVHPILDLGRNNPDLGCSKEMISLYAVAQILNGNTSYGVGIAKDLVRQFQYSPKLIEDKVPAIRAEKTLQRLGVSMDTSIEDEVTCHPETGKSNPYNKAQVQRIFEHDPINQL